jgi:hypothetical protein
MAVSFSTLLYSHCFDMFARPVVITPVASNPSGGAYSDMRAIFNSGPLTVTNDEGIIISVISDQETIVDIRSSEFVDAGHAIPIQGDLIHFDGDTDIAGGDYEIIDTSNNSGGQITYGVRKYEAAAPLRQPSGWEIP